MTPETLAELHAAAFAHSRGWSAGEFRDLLASPLCFLCAGPSCFALGRVIADEAELLTIATHPTARRQGLAPTQLAYFEEEARRRGATRAFLEVAADNAAARTLYSSQGYATVARRKGYYPRQDGPAVDALVLEKRLA